MSYPIVIRTFPAFTTKFEGRVPWMYTDNLNLVTTGVGNLIDPVSVALRLPWKHGASGPPASPGEIQSAWQRVKSAGLQGIGGGSSRFAALSDLRLSESDIDNLVAGKMSANETILKQHFPAYDTWPADAQMGLHSMAWAMGANFGTKYPHFSQAVNALVPNFEEAATQSYMQDASNPGLVPRNAANHQLFMNASTALKEGMPFDALLWDGIGDAAGHLASGLGTIASGGLEIAGGATTLAQRNPGKVLAFFGACFAALGGGFYFGEQNQWDWEKMKRKLPKLPGKGNRS